MNIVKEKKYVKEKTYKLKISENRDDILFENH